MTQVGTANRATSDVELRKEVLKRIDDEGIEFILLWFTDIEGHLKSFAVTPSEIEDALDDGMGFDGSSITGFNAIEESDMVAIPDPETYQLMPWREGETKVGRMICDIVTPDGNPYEGDPRYVLRRALDRMKSMGFDTFNVGPELEYFLFKDDKGTETLDEGGYFAMTTLDAATELRQQTVRALEGMGIQIEYVHHEVGPSQHEIDMRFAPALEMADHTVTYRLIVKEVAKKAGFHATFMPKPIFGENGSGMHTHQSLFKEGRNALYDAEDEWHLSDVGKGFIAGQLRHAREIAAVFAQWVNSYKRLVPGYEAPVYVAWSRRNRSALIRIPLYKPGAEQATRAEIRCPDPACNPYLTFACLLHAGLEGIKKGYELPPPMETNLYHLTAEQRRGPRHRRAAGDARRGDHGAVAVGAREDGARPAHLRPLRRAEAKGMGRVPRPALPVGDGQVLARPLISREMRAFRAVETGQARFARVPLTAVEGALRRSRCRRGQAAPSDRNRRLTNCGGCALPHCSRRLIEAQNPQQRTWTRAPEARRPVSARSASRPKGRRRRRAPKRPQGARGAPQSAVSRLRVCRIAPEPRRILVAILQGKKPFDVGSAHGFALIANTATPRATR